MASHPSGGSTATFSFMLSVNLLRVHLIASSVSLIKILNNIGSSVGPCHLCPPGLWAIDHYSLVYVMLMLCHAAMPCHVMLCHVVLCHMLWCVIYYITLYCIALCFVVLLCYSVNVISCKLDFNEEKSVLLFDVNWWLRFTFCQTLRNIFGVVLYASAAQKLQWFHV